MPQKQESPNDKSVSPDKIEMSFSLTRKDILWYNLHFNIGIIILAIIFLVLLLPGLILTLKYPGGDLGMFFVWLEIGFALGLLICLGVILIIVLQIFYIKSDAVDKAMRKRNYIINSAGVAVFTDEGQLVRAWTDFKKINHTRQGYYLRTSEKVAIILPLWAFKSPEDLLAFKALVKSQKS
jgi:hypothetical protein